MRAFANALDAIPLALAENSGLSPIDTLADIKSQQVTQNNPRLGIDSLGLGENGQLLPVHGGQMELTWDRHESTTCLRSVNIETTAISARHSGGANDPQGGRRDWSVICIREMYRRSFCSQMPVLLVTSPELSRSVCLTSACIALAFVYCLLKNSGTHGTRLLQDDPVLTSPHP